MWKGVINNSNIATIQQRVKYKDLNLRWEDSPLAMDIQILDIKRIFNEKNFTVRLLFQILYKGSLEIQGAKVMNIYKENCLYLSESIMQACVIHSLGMLLAKSMKVTSTWWILIETTGIYPVNLKEGRQSHSWSGSLPMSRT